MNMIETWQPAVEILGWTLIHFIWQGTLVALSLAFVLRMLRGASTNARYATACAALLMMLAAPLATMALISLYTPEKTASGATQVLAAQTASQTPTVEIEPIIAPIQTDVATITQRPWLSLGSANIAPLLPWMILLWLSGVTFFSMRLVGGWIYTQRMKHHGVRPLEEKWQLTLRRLCDQLQARRPVRLLESALVRVPTVIGWLRPIILLPASALSGLTPQQLEAIIAHELAHIRRHDYLINLLQAVVETLLFYHPAVWWVSRRIREERENCCDDLAAAVCGDALTYARALLEMEQLRAAGPELAVAANGGSLMNRIHRLVGARTPQPNRFSGLVAGLIALTAVVGVGAGAQILVPAPDNDSLINPGGPGQEIVSVRKREAGSVKTFAETTGKSTSAAEAQQIDSIRDDRAAEALLPALQHASWEVRKAAVESLAEFRGARAVELLIAAMKDDHRQVRERAVAALGTRGAGRLAEPLIAALADHDWNVREQAAIALGRTNDERAVDALLIALVDSAWAVREQAARSLGTTGGERGVEPLINALRDQHEQVREAAAKSLGIIGDRRAIEPLNRALQDTDEQVRKKAAEALGLFERRSGGSSMGALRNLSGAQAVDAHERTVNQQASVAENLRALRSSNPLERAVAACSLGRLGATEAIPSLIELLGDETPIQPIKCWHSGLWSPALQTFKQASPGEQAAIALASMGQSAVEPLIAALSYGNRSVRRNAAWAIGEVRGGRGRDRSAAVDPLILALGDEDTWVRMAAAFSLGELRPRQATEPLIAALGDADLKVREMAAWALGEMKSRRGVESLATLLLRDEAERVRRKAAWALGEIRDSSALEALTYALNDQDQQVRATVKWALSEIRD